MITKNEVIDALIKSIKNSFNYTDAFLNFKIAPSENYFELKIERSDAIFFKLSTLEEIDINDEVTFNPIDTYLECETSNSKEMNLNKNSDTPGDYDNQLSEKSKNILIKCLIEINYINSLSNIFKAIPKETFLRMEETDNGIVISGKIKSLDE